MPRRNPPARHYPASGASSKEVILGVCSGVPSNQEYGAKRDPPAWVRLPFIMVNPLKKGYLRGKEGVNWELEKIGKRETRVE